MIDIAKGPVDDVWHKVPLTWRPLKYPDGHRGATVSCDKGHSSSLTDHNISDDGIVTPSLSCPPSPDSGDWCEWDENVRLLDWIA